MRRGRNSRIRSARRWLRSGGRTTSVPLVPTMRVMSSFLPSTLAVPSRKPRAIPSEIVPTPLSIISGRPRVVRSKRSMIFSSSINSPRALPPAVRGIRIVSVALYSLVPILVSPPRFFVFVITIEGRRYARWSGRRRRRRAVGSPSTGCAEIGCIWTCH